MRAKKPPRYELLVADAAQPQRLQSLGPCRSLKHAVELLNGAFAAARIGIPGKIYLVPNSGIHNCEKLEGKDLRQLTAEVGSEPTLKVKEKPRILIDATACLAVLSCYLDYKVSWYNPGRQIAIVPRKQPEIVYLVDLEEKSCTCDTFYYLAQDAKALPCCRHMIVAHLALRNKLLSN